MVLWLVETEGIVTAMNPRDWPRCLVKKQTGGFES